MGSVCVYACVVRGGGHTNVHVTLYLLLAERGAAVEEFSADHGESDDVAQLGVVLQAAVELTLKLTVEETGEEENMSSVRNSSA